MIKKTLKKILPNSFIQFLKVGFDNYYYYKKLNQLANKDNQKKIYLLGTTIHKNYGDHLITLSELKFLEKYIPESKVVEIPTEIYEIYKNRIKNIITEKDLIIINGGGWMGNLWEKEELLIEDMVSSFPNNKIIIFPQTIYYDKNIDSYDRLLCSSKRIFGKHNNLTISVREENSYKFATSNYKHNKIILVPDIALFYINYTEEYRKVNKNKTIKLCLRRDRENINGSLSYANIKTILNDKKHIVEDIDTISNRRISERKREKSMIRKLKEFAESELIITDRLHAMIISYIVGTPCAVFDNKTMKVSGVYEKWLFKTRKIYPSYKHTLKETENFIVAVLQDNKKDDIISFDFDKLIEEVKLWQKSNV